MSHSFKRAESISYSSWQAASLFSLRWKSLTRSMFHSRKRFDASSGHQLKLAAQTTVLWTRKHETCCCLSVLEDICYSYQEIAWKHVQCPDARIDVIPAIHYRHTSRAACQALTLLGPNRQGAEIIPGALLSRGNKHWMISVAISRLTGRQRKTAYPGLLCRQAFIPYRLDSIFTILNSLIHKQIVSHIIVLSLLSVETARTIQRVFRQNS
jgi:hypothetical protein